MLRIVRPPAGGLTIDEKGKAAGRGAYLCRNRVCWALALRGTSLEHALHAPVSEAEREALRRYAEGLPADQPAAGQEDGQED